MNSNGYTSGKPDVPWWMTQIATGVDYRKRYAYEDKWPVWRAYYRGDFAPKVLPMNLFFKMLRMTVPRIYFRNPAVAITPTRPGAEQMALAQMLERLDNRLISLMSMKASMKTMIQRTWMYGTSYGKIGFGSEFAYNRRSQAAGTDAGPAADKTLGRERLEYSSNIKDGMPWFLPGHTGDLIVPAGTVNFNSCRWMAERVIRPVEDVKADPRLSHNKNIKASRYYDMSSSSSPRDKGEYREGMVDLLVVKDSKYNKVIIIAPGQTSNDNRGGEVLFFDNDPLQTETSFGIRTLIFNEEDDVCWGLPDSKILEPQQLEANETRTQIMWHRRATVVKMLVQAGMMDEDEIAKMTSEDVLAAITVKDLNAIKILQAADIPAGLFRAMEQVENDVREVTGFSRNQAGEYAQGSADRTAYEASVVRESSEIRLDERRDSTADMMVGVLQDCNQLVFEHWKDDQVDLVVGPEGTALWVAYRPEMLKTAKYAMTIDPDSGSMETRQARIQKGRLIYGDLKTNPLIDPELLSRYYVTQYGDPELDHLIRGMGAMRQGVGGNPEQPLQLNQYMDMLSKKSPNSG